MYQSGQSQSVDGGLPSKTPVSLLQELCMRRGISPKYDLLQIEGPVHEPTFVYRVTVGEFAANGSGQTKKKAKHAAAKAVLDIIIQGGSGGQGQTGSTPELSSQIVSPYDDGIPGNPVGALQELCMSRRWPPPTYELAAEEGFPHERTFSICCTIGNHKEIGSGKSKKLSKRQAANKMLLKLKDQPVEQTPMSVLADDDDEVNKQSGSPVTENSCPTLNKACTKVPFSVLHANRACSHLLAVFNASTYRVCENCFKLISEVEKQKGFKSYFHNSSFLQDETVESQDPNMQCHTRILYGAESDTIVSKYISDVKKSSLSIESELLNCKYSEADVSKLEKEFDKLIKKESEKTVEVNELQKLHTSRYFDPDASVNKLRETNLPDKNRETENSSECKNLLKSDVDNVHTDTSFIDYSQAKLGENLCIDSRSPKLVKELVHSFEF
ncbi:Interferon-inducible double-stranded RNA-dependent protein kinase activator A-like protein A [Armadillidium vulgare]|nr:Interferon-inducible double-stranded RNA-dependent protein kinase activator A-like protein A [Armadillidium vulgare]